jgi:hypothetical protein
MAHLYKRGKIYWIKYKDYGKAVRKSLKVTTKQAADRKSGLSRKQALNISFLVG